MLKTNIITITPDQDTAVLVGPEGLVLAPPAIGPPVILAARNEGERAAAVQHIADLLAMGLVPYGLPLNQRNFIAMFGGPVTRGCRWVPASEAPPPVGGEPMPTAYAVFAVPEPRRTAPADDLITISEAAALLGVTTQAISGRIARGDLVAYDDPAEPNPRRRRRVSRAAVEELRNPST